MKSARTRDEPARQNVDPVAVVVESDFVQQRRADDIRRVDHSAVRRIAEGVAGGRNVVAAPHRRSEVLCDLFGQIVAEDRELAAELVIDADDLFLHIGRNVVAAQEDRISAAFTPLLAGKDAGLQQRRRVWIDHAGRDRIAGERADPERYHVPRHTPPARTISERYGGADVGGGWNGKCGILAGNAPPYQAVLRNGLVQRLSLNQPAPFHVVEEECLVLLRPEINRAADVESEGVEAQFGDFLRSRVEVVAGIERVIAQELPRAGVKLLRAGLDDSCHRGRRRQAVFRAVVRGHLPELGDGVHRGHNVGTAATAAVAALAPSSKYRLWLIAHAVETHIGVAADWRRDLEIALAAGCAGRQRNQRVHAAAVGGELAELLSGDDVADFAGVGLHGDRGGFDRDLFLGAADLELEVDTGTIADLQHDVLLLGNFEAGGRGSNGVASDAKIGDNVLAVAAGVMVRDRPVSMLVTVMVAFGTAAPVGSVTVPTMVASMRQALSGEEHNKCR